jgi:hypothetical protein
VTITTDTPKLNPISAVLSALHIQDPALGVLAEVRETLPPQDLPIWDNGISRYLKLRNDAIVNAYFNDDPAAASLYMEIGLAKYDVPETIRRAADLDSSPLMMEIAAYAMALATINPGHTGVWRRFQAIVDHLYRPLPVNA